MSNPYPLKYPHDETPKEPQKGRWAIKFHASQPYEVRVSGDRYQLSGPKSVVLDRLRLARLSLERAEREAEKFASENVSVEMDLQDILP